MSDLSSAVEQAKSPLVRSDMMHTGGINRVSVRMRKSNGSVVILTDRDERPNVLERRHLIRFRKTSDEESKGLFIPTIPLYPDISGFEAARSRP